MEAVAKLYEVVELVDASSLDPKKLEQTAWFFITLYFGRRGRENKRQLTKSSLKLSIIPNSGLEYYEPNREAPGGVFSRKNHQGGLDQKMAATTHLTGRCLKAKDLLTVQ